MDAIIILIAKLITKFPVSLAKRRILLQLIKDNVRNENKFYTLSTIHLFARKQKNRSKFALR